ncbi:hypothetical protein VOLCADRAFT_86577 [Volvox carteri f. nagariensis]|uniref:cysteine dioxygenase n=1 Tax=Volvox carteri f. nagariensis TaxID=3068 RepID=D8TJ15_VOLCA|nr:uncharacterized protein VOLCADRAFT_86577 [Volvox carteri f. nagariensis]EFJ52461.1 hypothetical protein VOLCADRAFT_86577 [Volvox carteri f. nagariensis]|eukprot:XP_002946534.1 hypothetical protein VOLCADRAFT_86577 [Volvox carteri f. nagariensis]
MHSQSAVAGSQTANSQQTSGSRLQDFFTAARRAVLHGTVNESNPDTVAQLANMMGAIRLEELGLDSDMVADPFLGALKLHLRDSRIKYMRIYEDPSLTFGLFCFPAGTVIPLHNHPDGHSANPSRSATRLLFGQLRVSAYDWVVQPAAPITSGSARARLVCDAVIGPATPPLVLFPSSGGNLHEFTAETPCAVLDLLTPPYEPPERNCTYYRVQRQAASWPVGLPGSRRAVVAQKMRVGDEVELEVFDPPGSFEVVSGCYPGDPVV